MKKNLKPKNMAKTIFRMFSYFKYNLSQFILGMVFILISTVSTVAANGILSPIIDSLSPNTMGLFTKYLLIMIGLVISISVFQYLGMLFMARLAQSTIHKLREDMFHHMQKLNISYFDTNQQGDLMSTFTNDVDMLNQSLEQSLAQILTAFVSVFGSIFMMIKLSPLLTVIVLVMLFIMIISISTIGKRSARYFRERQADIADMNSYVEEMLYGQKIVKAYNYEERNINNFQRINENLRKSSTSSSTYGVMMMPVTGNLSHVMYALVAIIGGINVIGGRLSIGNIASFLQYTRTISRPITQVSNQLNTLFAALAGAERIFNILDEPVELEDGDVKLLEDCNYKNDYCWIVPDKDGKSKIPLRGDIRFDNVDFGYNPDKKVLHNISLFAKPGQKIALVGSTGAGKTTITNLVNRFYDIQKGTITFDSIDIKRINPTDLRSTMSMVLQDVHLFEGTIRENIRYGRLDATDEEVIEAAKLSNAHQFIMELSDGYDTFINSEASNLSQGQMQLLSIARAAIANPVVLILDEATSSIDTRTEEMIEKAMNTLMEDRTTFIIAHRLSTVRSADAIMVMENGEIIERGSHDDLMKEKGKYYELNMGLANLS